VGHGLNNTVQDVLIRWRRMAGDEALWLPGTDHAGIATQLMVERELVKEGTSRTCLGREKFLERMWSWKAKYGGMDVSDAKKLKSLEEENGKLKKLLADAMLDNAALKDLLGKKW